MNTETDNVISELDITSAAIELLQERYAVVPDASTEEGYKLIKAGLSELTGLRSKVSAKHKELKESVLVRGRKLDGAKNDVIAALKEIEAPMREAKAEIDEKAAKEKAEFEARLETKLQAIKDYPRRCVGKSSAFIGELIAELEKVEHEDFYHRSLEAAEAKAAARSELANMLTQSISQEQADEAYKAEREAMAKQQAELREQQRLQAEAMAEQQAQIKAQQEKLDAKAKELAEVEAKNKAAEEAEASKAGEPILVHVSELLKEEQAARHPKYLPEDWTATELALMQKAYLTPAAAVDLVSLIKAGAIPGLFYKG